MIHSATAGSWAPRALHRVTPAGTCGITRSAPADISWTSRRHGSLASMGSRDPGTPNGSTTTSTSSAESGSCSPPVQTSAVIPSGKPPIASTQPGSGSHTLIVLAVVMTATLLQPLPGPGQVRLAALPRLGHVIVLVRCARRRTDDDNGARSRSQARPDDGAGPAVRVRAVGGAAEDQHVGLACMVEHDARRETFGDLRAHADAGIQADRLADRSAQHLTGSAPAPTGLPRGRRSVAGDLMTRGFQGEDRMNLGGAQAGFPTRPSQSGHGLGRAVDTDHDAPNTGIFCHDDSYSYPLATSEALVRPATVAPSEFSKS